MLSFFAKPQTRLNAQTQKLAAYFERFKDDIELCLPALPVFYAYEAPDNTFTNGYDPIFSDYSQKHWDIFSASALQQNYEANVAIRLELKRISDSGSSGISYILKHPSISQNETDRVLDDILTLWKNSLPHNISVMQLMYEHATINSFDTKVYTTIRDYIDSKSKWQSLSALEVDKELNKTRHIEYLINELTDTAYQNFFAETLLYQQPVSENLPHFIKLYIAHCLENDFNFDTILDDINQNDTGILKQALNKRIKQQTELQDNLSAQLRLQSPLQTVDTRHVRTNGPILLKDLIKSFKLGRHQFCADNHLVIDLNQIVPAQQFFDLSLAAFIKKSPRYLPQDITDYLTAKEKGTLEIPLCPDDDSPLYPILSQAVCVKTPRGSDKIFNSGGSSVRRLQAEPNYRNRILQDLNNYIKGHYFSDLTTKQTPCLNEMGIHQKVTLASQLGKRK